MENSILTTLSSINATILSILFGIAGLYFIYIYQITSEAKDKLNELRFEVSQIMRPTHSGGVAEKEYSHDGKVDLNKVKNKISVLTGLFHHQDLKEQFNIQLEERSFSEEEVSSYGHELFGLTGLIQKSYPFEGGSSKRSAYTKEWKKDFTSFTQYLSWIWDTRKYSIIKLMSEFTTIYNKKRDTRHEKTKEDTAKLLKEEGESEPEILNILEQDTRLTPKISVNLAFPVEDFFIRVNKIEGSLISAISAQSSKLEFYHGKFKIKSKGTIFLIFTIYLLTLGILLPLFIHLYWTPPYIKEVQLALLLLSIVPYIYFGLFFLKTIVSLRGL